MKFFFPASHDSNGSKTSSQKENKESDTEVGLSETKKSKTPVLKQTNLNAYLNLDEMPESASKTTGQGFFDDVCSTPVSGKKINNPIEEPNVDNAFGFDDYEDEDVDAALLSIRNESAPIRSVKKDFQERVEEKILLKARGKSALPSRIFENRVKNTLRGNVLKKKTPQDMKNVEPTNESSDSDEKDDWKQTENNSNDLINDPKTKKKEVLDSITFSDTFDLISKEEELESKIPEEVPLFVDLEPAHFTAVCIICAPMQVFFFL